MEERIIHEEDPEHRKQKAKYEECENYFDFLSELPTLLHITSISIAITLLKAAGLGRLLPNCKHECDESVSEYIELKERALKNVKQLSIPKDLQLYVAHCVMPIGWQLEVFFCLEKQTEEQYRFWEFFRRGGTLHWTMEGVIDQVKSLKELIRKYIKGKRTTYWFKIACRYCLKPNIIDLWKRIPQSKRISVDDVCKNHRHHIIAYWIAVLMKQLPNLMAKLLPNDSHDIYFANLSVNENMVSWSIFEGNPFALKYFWHKLSDHEKNVNTETWVNKLTKKLKRERNLIYQGYDVYPEMLWFLLTQMTDYEKQKQIFHAHSGIILKSLLLCWPSQRFFLPAMIKKMDDIDFDIYAVVMKGLLLQIKEERMTGELFHTIWHHSPLKLQEQFLLELNRKPNKKLSIISSILFAGDVQTICCILLKNYSEDEKKSYAAQLIYSKFESFIEFNKLANADALILNLHSDSDITKFKQYFMETRGIKLCTILLKKLNFYAADQLLAWAFQSPKEIQHFKVNKLHLKEIFIFIIFASGFDNAVEFIEWYFKSEQSEQRFKQDFFKEENSFYLEKLLHHLRRLEEEGWDSFETFIYYCYYPPKPEDLGNLKEILLKNVGKILEDCCFEFARKLINWCFSTRHEVVKFKNDLLLSRRGIDIILRTMQYIPNWNNTIHTLSFFYPFCSELVEKLKYTLTTRKFKCYNRRYSPEKQRSALFVLLDFFIEEHNGGCFEREQSLNILLKNILEG